jgi:hypothetical protein
LKNMLIGINLKLNLKIGWIHMNTPILAKGFNVERIS